MVSIIIPVYNTEKYLKRCVTSALNQIYKDLEINLIDDGSTDTSAKICDNFASSDKRVKVIHKENGGLSSARNLGIEVSSGEYLTFLDSDDYFANDYIEKSIYLVNKWNADIAVMQMCYVAENTNGEIKNNNVKSELLFTAKEAIEVSLYQTFFSCCAPGKLYRRATLKNIRFPIGKLSEDLAVCHRILENAKKIVYTNEIGYYYRQHDNSIMHTFNPKRLDALEWGREIEDYCSQNYPAVLNAAKCRTFNVAIHLLLDLPDSGTVRAACHGTIIEAVKRTRGYVIRDKKVRKREKMAALLSYFGESSLKKVWNSRMAIKKREN